MRRLTPLLKNEEVDPPFWRYISGNFWHGKDQSTQRSGMKINQRDAVNKTSIRVLADHVLAVVRISHNLDQIIGHQ